MEESEQSGSVEITIDSKNPAGNTGGIF